jgi:Zn-dependent M32 family carboxypeptidase
MVTQKTAGVNETMEKKELEQLFIDCVEDMRAEIDARKKVGGKNATK